MSLRYNAWLFHKLREANFIFRTSSLLCFVCLVRRCCFYWNSWALHPWADTRWRQKIGWDVYQTTTTQHNAWYLSQLSEALSPHFLPMRIPGIRLNRWSITVSEHLESQSRDFWSHGFIFLGATIRPETGVGKIKPLRVLAVCDDLETRRSHLDDVIVSCCVSIVNPRTRFLRSDMTHSRWLSWITDTCTWFICRKKRKTFNKEQSPVCKVEYRPCPLWCKHKLNWKPKLTPVGRRESKR